MFGPKRFLQVIPKMAKCSFRTLSRFFRWIFIYILKYYSLTDWQTFGNKLTDYLISLHKSTTYPELSREPEELLLGQQVQLSVLLVFILLVVAHGARKDVKRHRALPFVVSNHLKFGDCWKKDILKLLDLTWIMSQNLAPSFNLMSTFCSSNSFSVSNLSLATT